MLVHGGDLNIGTHRTVLGCSIEAAIQAEYNDGTSALDTDSSSLCDSTSHVSGNVDDLSAYEIDDVCEPMPETGQKTGRTRERGGTNCRPLCGQTCDRTVYV